MDYPKFIILNQKEESISKQLVNLGQDNRIGPSNQKLWLFSCPSALTEVLGAQKNWVPTQNVYFGWGNKKINN